MEQNKDSRVVESQLNEQNLGDITSLKSFKKPDLKDKKTLGIVAGLIVLLVVIVVVVFASQGKTDSGEGYEISNQRIETIDGYTGITAKAKNTCGRTETLFVTWNLYDSSGGKIGTAMGVVEDIADGQTKDLKGILLPSNGELDNSKFADQVKSFELDEVTFLKAENQRLSSEINRYQSRY